jgi:hypothetical protein
MAARYRFVRVFCLATLVATVFVAAAWMVMNFGQLPQYGDTNEYLALAKTLHVDQYRTIFYPLVLRWTGIFYGSSTSPHTNVIYLVQCAAVFISCFILAGAALNALKRTQHADAKSNNRLAALTALFVSTNPLVAHFSLSVMTDSLASSLTIASIGCAVRATDSRQRRIWLPATFICIALMALSRVDKLYIAIGICVTAVALTCMARRGDIPASRESRPWVMALVLGIAIFSAPLINKFTQTVNPNRPPLDISSMAFNRVVWPRLSKVYPKLPEDARQVISFEDAKIFDTHNNNVYPLLNKLLAQNPGNQKIINEITITTLRNFPLQVAGKTFFDMVKYEAPNLAFPMELVSALPKSTATDWTYSRMSMFSPKLTDVSLALSSLVFLLVQLPLAACVLRRHVNRGLLFKPIFAISLVAITLNSVLFSLEAGMDAHIRYALPTYTLILIFATLLSLQWLLAPVSAERENGSA